MYTRKQYLNHEVTHQEYYAQFATPATRRLVANFLPTNAAELLAQDEHLNNIPLYKWDQLAKRVNLRHVQNCYKETGYTGGVSLSDLVCILKATARMIINPE